MPTRRTHCWKMYPHAKLVFKHSVQTATPGTADHPAPNADKQPQTVRTTCIFILIQRTDDVRLINRKGNIEMVRFAVVTTQRTGATFFTTSLQSHPQIQCPGTLFPQISKFKFFHADRSDSAYLKYRSSSTHRQRAHWFARRKLIYEFLESAYTTEDDSVAMGYKFSYNHLARYPVIEAWLRENNIHVIHYIRENLLKRYLSSETKKVRHIAHSTEPLKPVQIHIDSGKMKQDLARNTQQIAKYRAAFSSQPYLEVLYESFCANQEAETRKVLQFLGINEFVPLQTTLVKINPNSIAQIVDNYDQLVQALRNTSFEKYLA